MKERLQKLISAAGLCSRRRAEEWIAQGKVTVNGDLAHLGDSADPETDAILVSGEPLPAAPGRTTTILLYKPRGAVTTLSDEKGRSTVAELLPPELGRLYPVGRLDRFSEGLLLMTNDGALAQRLTHPAGEVDKTYRLWVSGWTDEALPLLRRPLVLDGYRIKPPEVRLLWVNEGNGQQATGNRPACRDGSQPSAVPPPEGPLIRHRACGGRPMPPSPQGEGDPACRDGSQPSAVPRMDEAAGNGERVDTAVGSDAHIAPVIASGNDAAAPRRQEASGDASLRGINVAALEITIHEGRNRQIRRMAQAAGLTVTRLKRVAEGPLTLGDLKPGQWRELTEAELQQLKIES